VKRKDPRFGRGFRVMLGNRRYKRKAGSLPLIEKGDRHEILNDGRVPLKTLNFYVPPAHDAEGDELPRGRR
jgi:mannose-6-phosphate isomerase-like protein (cupin superfamily)